jgi:hypothetical protein
MFPALSFRYLRNKSDVHVEKCFHDLKAENHKNMNKMQSLKAEWLLYGGFLNCCLGNLEAKK